MVYAGATFLSLASRHVITLFNNNRKVILNQHKRTVPLCSKEPSDSVIIHILLQTKINKY